ncbi:MAG: Tex family protein [Acidobacteriota bacterium]
MAASVLEEAFITIIARELGCRPQQVIAAAALLAEGSTVPFIARYRKEATGGLDDEKLEELAKRRSYFLELQDRRDTILESIAEQGKLTDALEQAIRAATSKRELEDLYLPYKPKRRTRAQIARERGLEPLADQLLSGAAVGDSPDALAEAFVDAERGVADAAGALAGARDVLAERLAEDAGHRAQLRRSLASQGAMSVRVLTGKEDEAQVYKDYFDHSEPARAVPSHRLLAILRGEREGFLISSLEIDDEAEVDRLVRSWSVALESPCGRQVAEATADGYKRLLRPSITNEVRGELRERAEAEAIRVFRGNLEALLMQAPLGQVVVMGLDPGYRTGCKLAVVDGTGRVLATQVIYPIEPRARGNEAANAVASLVSQHKVSAIAIGNGTGGRETEAFARQVVRDAQLGRVVVAIVPETGASVYSASAVARKELPDLDVALRGAVSIARRFQDPLAELVKIEPRSLGVGQYQHDVDQKALAGELDTTVESAVNRVGVELNTASPSLLQRVSGLSARLAGKIVQHRDANGPFGDRRGLLAVPGFGAKTFEQAAGFLRIQASTNPLDRTAVHPERYPVVEAMANDLEVPLAELVGNPAIVHKVRFDRFLDVDQGLGRFTLDDIKRELEQPGRDPRPEFEVPDLREDVTSIDDLETGMELEGRVSNVTNFGAFVDLGVKRDGLVHLSELSDKWVDNPQDVVQVGQVVKVRVLEVDRQRGRIGLSMRSPDAGAGGGGSQGGSRASSKPGSSKPGSSKPGSSKPTAGRPGGGGGRPKSRSGGGARGGRSTAKSEPSRPATVEDLMRKFNRSR